MSGLRGWVAVVGIFLGGLAADAAVTQVGNVTGVTITTNAAAGNRVFSFALSTGGSVEITPFAPDVVRVDLHWVGPFETDQPMIAKPFTNWPAVSATLADNGSSYRLETTQLIVDIDKTPFKVHFKDKSGFFLLQDDKTEFDPAYNFTGQRGTGSSKLKAQKVMPSNQAIMGLGEYGGPMNRRGREIDCWNTGTYNWGEFQNPTYLNIPFFYGLQPAGGGNPAFVYGVFFNNPCRSLFKFGTAQGDRYSFEAGDGRMDYFFFGGGATHTMAEVIDRYSELTGRPTMLPKWGLGHHLSRFSYDNQAWVEYIANQSTVEDMPLDAVYLDIDYMDADADGDFADGQLRQLTINSKFPNPSGMLNYCDARGVKVVPLIEPWLEPGDPLHGEANGLLHFIKDNGGNTVTRNIYVGAVSWFDFSSSPMQVWWRNKIVNWFNTLPFDGIWNDLTEPEGGDQIPHNALMWIDGKFGTSTTDSRRWWSNERNYFGLRCSKTSYDAMLQKNPNLRPFVLSRSGNAGLQRYAVSWSGDTRANWFYQRATIRFGMGAMIAGVAWYGNDVGGFAGTASAELMTRSTEFNALTPFFRNHADKAAADREPWRFGEPYKSHQRNMIKMRYRLMPYLYTLAYESTVTGEPMNVPPAFDYFADANTHDISDYEFLVGDYILAAPVYNEGASTRQVYLPYAPGVEWYYWPSAAPNVQPSGTKYGGGQTVNVSAPLGQMPMFVRSGAIIPMGPSMQYANQTQAGWMDINCWPAGVSEFTLHEDDGETWDYLSGEYARRRMVSERTELAWTLDIEAKQGTYNTGARDFYVYCFNPPTNAVQSVKLNGAPLAQLANFNDAPQGWRMTSEGRVGIKLPDTGAAAEIRVSWGDESDVVQLAHPAYNVPETSAFVRVYITRAGDTTGAVSATFATLDASALAGLDYTPVTGVVNWAAGDTADKFVDVLLADDASYRGDRFFLGRLAAVTGADVGAVTSTTINILENEPLPPGLMVTNPPAPLYVSATVGVVTVQGVANANVWSGLVWSNALTGASGTAPIGFAWTIPGVTLGVGTNWITIAATNVAGTGAFDSGADTVYNNGWDAGDNGGYGWGAWQFQTSSGDINQNGRFMATATNVNIGTPAWGLYANTGNNSEARRLMTNALAVGQTVSVRMDNGFINPGSGVGVALQNDVGTTLWEFFFNGGDTFYSMSSTTTDIGWTSGGLDVEFTLTGPTNFTTRITPYGGATRTNNGVLINAANQQISAFRAWNFNAGSGSQYDFFFNNLTRSGGSGATTSVLVQVVRPASDGLIPQWWRDRYALSGPDSGDHEDRDGDGRSNLEEYLADSIPTNNASRFGRVHVRSVTPQGTNVVIELEIEAPTTNSRVYDITYSSNLMSAVWSPLGLVVTGHPGGAALQLQVTNRVEESPLFRAGVRLP